MRYGRIMIFTDQDVDGSHIKGLVMNFFHSYWPELLDIPGFIISLTTPIVKAKNKKEEISFYTLSEYNKWCSERKVVGKLNITRVLVQVLQRKRKNILLILRIKIEYFAEKNEMEAVSESDDIVSETNENSISESDSNNSMVESNISSSDNTLSGGELKQNKYVKSFKLAFDKSKSSSRKNWLKLFNKDDIITQDQKVSYTDYLIKN